MTRIRWAPARCGTSISGLTPNQTYLLNIDGENNQLRVLRRSDGAVVGGFGRSGRYAGQFHWVHNIAVDSKATSSRARSTTPTGCRNSSRQTADQNSHGVRRRRMDQPNRRR